MKKFILLTYPLFYLLLCLHFVASDGEPDPLCVVRLFSGDEFFNDEGPAACAAYDARCHDDGANLAAGQSAGLSCNCQLDATLMCPACKCNPLHPLFNGTMCKSSQNTSFTCVNTQVIFARLLCLVLYFRHWRS